MGNPQKTVTLYDMQGKKIKGVKNQKAKALIKYEDDTTYFGEVYVNEKGEALRKGYGLFDFFPAKKSYGVGWGCGKNEYLFAYEGEFDDEVSKGVYGNGIMYYTDASGKPIRFSKAFFSLGAPLDEYFGNQKLLDGFTPDMETPYLRFREDYDRYLTDKKWEVKHHEYVFAGASYFTFMNIKESTPFSKYFGDYDAVDVGCGGSVTCDWLSYYDKLIKPYTPDKIVFALGGNDVAACGGTPELVYKNFKKLLTMCKKDNPAVKFYIVGQWYTPSTVNNFSKRAKLNALYFPKLASEFDGAIYIPIEDIMYKDAKTKTPVDDLLSNFLPDCLHMNDKGYTLWTGRIKEYLDK